MQHGLGHQMQIKNQRDGTMGLFGGKFGIVMACAAAGFLSACAVGDVSRGTAAEAELPVLRWDHVDQGDAWTETTLEALRTHGATLLIEEPRDIAADCPAYPEASEEMSAAFWAGLLSTLAKHESTWRQTAVGGGGRWFGLTQISPGTARGYGCEARSGQALLDGEKNLSCAVRIMAETVPRDGVVSHGMRGVAADWGPFHSTRKREDMKAWTRAQPYCTASAESGSGVGAHWFGTRAAAE